MSKLKKMVSMVLAMVMILAMSIPTFAANDKTEGHAATGTASDKGTITVSGVRNWRYSKSLPDYQSKI